MSGDEPRRVVRHDGGAIEEVEDAQVIAITCAVCRAVVLALACPLDGGAKVKMEMVERVPGLPEGSITPHVRPHRCEVPGPVTLARPLDAARRRLLEDVLAARRRLAADLDDGRWT